MTDKHKQRERVRRMSEGVRNPKNPTEVILDRTSLPAGCCEFCGKQAELRPYGPNGEAVCFPCAMKDEEAAKRQFDKTVLGK